MGAACSGTYISGTVECLPLSEASLTQQNVFEVRQRGVKGKSCSPQSAAQAPLLQPETSSTFRVSRGRSVRGRLHGRSENSGVLLIPAFLTWAPQQEE